MNRLQRYTAAIAAWDWSAIKSEALENPSEGEDGDTEGATYLGSIFSLSPSGKFYTPFACSNLEACEGCKGKGVTRPRIRKRAYKKAASQLETLRLSNLAAWDRFRAGKGPRPLSLSELTPKERKRRNGIRRRADVSTCALCAGYGSREALEDELWREALEAVADSYGMWLDGDGDGIYAACALEGATS